MKKQTRSILEELTEVLPERDTPALVESRGNHIISSAINLLESIRNHYGDQAADELERRIINSIKAKNIAKFARAARRLSNEN
jgi:hypothetical protein